MFGRHKLGRRKLLAALSATAFAPAASRAEQSKIVLGTATNDGAFVIYGVALIDALRLVDPTFELVTKATTGSQENVELLKQGEIDLGLVAGEIAHELLAPKARAENKLSVITVISPSPGMFAVRSSSRFHGIADLLGRPIVWNPRNSGLAVQARMMMDGLGLDMDKDFQPIYTEHFADGAPMVIDGRAAALFGSGLRWPGFVQLADSFGGCRFVVPNPVEIERIRKKHPFLTEQTVPAGLYRGQYDPIETVGTWSFMLARPELEDAIGFRLASDLHKLERTHGLTKHIADTTTRNTLSAITGPEVLQPGVASYYRKAGLME